MQSFVVLTNVILSVISPSVIVLSAITPSIIKHNCHYTECRGAKMRRQEDVNKV
jgi:hypothetical protein